MEKLSETLIRWGEINDKDFSFILGKVLELEKQLEEATDKASN